MGDTPYKYHYLRYNHYGVLRPNWLVRLILFFLCRHLVLLLVFGAMNFKGKAGPEMAFMLPLLDKAFIITDMPALLVLFVMGARRPDASAAYQWIWRHGRYLILGSIGAFFLIIGVRYGVNQTPLNVVEWAVITANIAAVTYIGKSAYISDLFAEFPPPRGDKS
ncbi:MAG: DUF2919 family protein [Rhodospirillales bacterium]|nr:DUF2919 family protein [Rhodospirillales bacterium]